MYKLNKNLIQFFIDEYTNGKKIERAAYKFDLSECFFKAYTAAQPTEEHKTNKAFEDFKKFREGLLREMFDNYDDIKAKHIEEEGKKTWGDLKKSKKGKKRVMF
jgi:hypothetical protein